MDAMTRRTLVLTLAGSAAVVAGAFALVPAETKRTPAPAAAVNSAATTRIYYFHGNYRCNTCRTIEAYAREAVTRSFAADLDAGRLDWQTVNVDEAANRHFIKDFGLYTRSLVVVDAKDPRHFKVLEQVWTLVGDKPAFQRYVEQEIRGFGRS